ncbi:MAG: tetratricopeptide (TPR) repeat protein [Myxococcota bacterium]|jgi:tetratricopeptide (TPR) repeat protein
MTHPLFIGLVAATLAFGGCGKKAAPAPDPPTPSVETKAPETGAAAADTAIAPKADTETAPPTDTAEAAAPDAAGPAALKAMVEPATDTVAASPTRASPAPTCDYDGVDFPAQTAQLHADLGAVAKAIGMERVTAPAGKTSWTFQHQGYVYAVAKGPKGYWLLSKLGGEAIANDCNGADLSVTQTNPTIIRLQTDDAEPDDCRPEFNYWDHWVFDASTGTFLAHYADFMGHSVGPDGPDVVSAGGELSSNGELSFRAPLSDLKVCATPKGDLKTAARHWLARGRKATQASDYGLAVVYFDHALAIDAKVAAAHSGRGYALLQRAKGLDLSHAVGHFKAALKLNNAPKFQGSVWFNIGTAHWGQVSDSTIPSARKDYYTKALEAFRKADALRPSAALKAKVTQAERALGVATTAVSAGGLCGVAETSRPGATSYGTVSEMATKTLGEYAEKTKQGLCEDNACEKDLMVLEGDMWFDVVLLDDAGGATSFYSVFDWWSGAFCPWFPEITFKHHGDYTIIRSQGEAYARWEGECDPEDEVVEITVIDRKKREIVGGFECTSGPEAMLTYENGQLTYTGCEDKTYTGTMAALHACAKKEWGRAD